MANLRFCRSLQAQAIPGLEDMADGMMPPFPDPGEFPVLRNEYSHSFSAIGQFDSSFSSSATTYDHCYTPSRRGSSDMSDFYGLSSSSTSLRSNGSNSPVDDAMFYSLISMSDVVKAEAEDTSHLYDTPCHKIIQNHNLMNSDYSQINSFYGQLNLQDTFDELPEMMFDNLPELLFNDTTSLPTSSSPDNFVIPSQTFISEPYRPTTPTNVTKAVLGPPLEEYTGSEETIKYFMSPREKNLQTPSSGFSSASHSTLTRTPPSRTLESSAVLHRIQSMGNSRVSKQPKRSAQAASNVEHIAAGVFRCYYPGCKSEHGFKRHEHLKRHQRTHGAQKPLQCRFCSRNFQLDRQDNYLAHVKLHANDKKGSRTKYFPEAQSVVDSLKRKRLEDKKPACQATCTTSTRAGPSRPWPSPSRRERVIRHRGESSTNAGLQTIT